MPACWVLPASPFEGPGDQDTGVRGGGGQNLSSAHTRTFHDRGPLCPDTALGMWPARWMNQPVLVVCN